MIRDDRHRRLGARIAFEQFQAGHPGMFQSVSTTSNCVLLEEFEAVAAVAGFHDVGHTERVERPENDLGSRSRIIDDQYLRTHGCDPSHSIGNQEILSDRLRRQCRRPRVRTKRHSSSPSARCRSTSGQTQPATQFPVTSIVGYAGSDAAECVVTKPSFCWSGRSDLADSVGTSRQSQAGRWSIRSGRSTTKQTIR